MKKIIILILLCLVHLNSKQINYSRTYNPTVIVLKEVVTGNPFNIVKNNKNLWLGRTISNNRFEKFTNTEYGIRAGIILIKNYNRLYNINTIGGIINKFAPPHENDTKDYINFVSKNLSIKHNTQLDLTDRELLACLCKFILIREGYEAKEKEILKIIYKYKL